MVLSTSRIWDWHDSDDSLRSDCHLGSGSGGLPGGGHGDPLESLEATGYQGIETAGRSTYQATVNFSARNLAP